MSGLTIASFLLPSPAIREKAFTPRVLRAGWKKQGIWPIKPNLVIDELEKICVDDGPELQFFDGPDADTNTKTPSPRSSQLSSPKTIRKLRYSIAKVQKNLNEVKEILNEASPSLSKKINKVFTGSLTQAELSAQRGEDLDRYLQASLRRKRVTSRRRVNAGGPLYVKDANRRIEEWKASEMKEEWEKRQRRRQRDEQKLLREAREEARTGGIIGEIAAIATGDQENLPYFVDTQGWLKK